MKFLFLFILSLLGVSGCSIDPAVDPHFVSEALTFAQPHQIQRHLVLEGSYLVGFRTVDEELDASPGQKHFQSFLQLQEISASDSSVKSSSILAVISLRNEIFLNYKKGTLSRETSLWEDYFLNLTGADDPIPHKDQLMTIADVRFRSDESARERLQEWYAQGRIYYAEPNGISQLSGIWSDYTTAYSESLPHRNKTQLEMMNLFEAYNTLETKEGASDRRPIIAVMDSGIDYEHPAFETQLWENPSKGELSCGNDDTYGCNTTKAYKSVLGDGSVHPYLTSGPGEECPTAKGASGCTSNCCHGTHVAGIIASNPKKDYGGICPVCRIMTLRIVGDIPGTTGGGILDSSIAAALRYVSFFSKADPVRVINASFGKFERSRTVSVLARSLFERNGTVIIGAAGNEDANRMQYPAALDQSIAVANVESSKKKASSSNFGTWVDVAAPGMQIENAIPGGSSEDKNGTSMSSPAVAAIAGLILASDPTIGAQTLRDAIVKTADPGLYASGTNDSYFPKIPGERSAIPLLGSGIIDANAAIKGANNPNQPAFIVLDRVRPGCGVVSNNGKNGAESSRSLFSLLALGFLLYFFRGMISRLLRFRGRS